MLDYSAMGARIRKSRKSKRLTQEQLAEIIDISPTFLSMIENGVKPGSFDTYMRIAAALDVTLDYLSQDMLPRAGENEQDCELLSVFHALTPRRRAFALDIIKRLKDDI